MREVASVLANQLAPLGYGVPSTPTLRQSDCVIFQSGKAYTFSGDVFAIVSCNLGVEGAVNYKNLMEVLRKYGDSLVDIDLDGGSVLLIKHGRSRTKLSFDPAIVLSIQAVPNLDPNVPWEPIPPDFATAVGLCESVAKQTRTDDVLSSINITPTFMEAASPAQIIRHNCTLAISDRFLIRAGILGKLLSVNLAEYQVVSHWLFLRSPLVTFAVPTYVDAFIDGMDDFLKPASNAIHFPEELEGDMPLISAVLGKGELMQVTLAGGRCVLTANGSGGTHEADADMVTPVGLSFSISPDMFRRVLSEFPDCTISENGIKVNNTSFSYAAAVE